MLRVKEAREHLVLDFNNAAHWRRELADKYPGDDRNIQAAEILERLAAGVSDIDDATMDVYAALFDEQPDSADSELLRRIGFDWHPGSAAEFVSRYIAEHTGG